MQKQKIAPKLTLVGAGPGDPELISVKGVNALMKADVVLYDALVNPELLKYVPLEAKRIYVGKRKNNHAYTQEQINALIVDMAFSHGHVVRLKGGDSFVFGRGHEELTYAEAFEIETEIIPGISSAIAVPELQKIPLTRRGVNESFWVLTGTNRDGKLSEDIRLAAQSTATVIILMGLSKLEEIAEQYRLIGKENLPAAVIQNGSLPGETIGIGTIGTLAKVVQEAKLGPPAIIIIGEVVKLHPRLSYKDVERIINQN